MLPLPHQYTVSLAAVASGYAAVSSPGLPPLRLAAPATFDGPGDAWSPEHLLLAAVQGCFLLTLRAVAAASKHPFLSVTVDTSGTADRNYGRTRFTEIVVCPLVTFPAGTRMETARGIIEKAEQNCLISASLSTPVRIDARIVVEQRASEAVAS